MSTHKTVESSTDRILVVLVHGYVHTPEDMRDVKSAVGEMWPDATVLAPRLPTSRFSLADANELAVHVASEIDHEVQQANTDRSLSPYRRIVLVGHSLGALIARKAYIVACGERARPSFESSLRKALKLSPDERFAGFAWAGLVERIVLLAAMNRGWRVSHHLSLVRAPLWAVGSLIGSLMRLATGKRPLIMTIRRGAVFITNLRIQWITLRNEQRERGVEGPLTIQLLGSRDDLVAPDDNIDLVSGSHFVYLDVPQSNHSNIIEMASTGVPAERRAVFQRALTRSKTELEAEAVIPSDDKLREPELGVTDVVFVIHGIRDEGYWTHKIARKVRIFGQSGGGVWATETSSYGYFAMLPFLFAIRRRQKVEWMMDRYAEALAHYPNARFHYVGHSNGTYLLAKALKLYGACRFSRVVFAGSVVRRHYTWADHFQRGQVEEVLNCVATRDWVVAFFPGLFEMLPVQDLGSAGHDGFKPAGQAGVTQLEFVRGGHGAAIEEKLWNAIACFITTGTLGTYVPPDVLARPRAWLVVLLGWYPPIIWLFIAAFLYGVWFFANATATNVSGPWTAGFVSALLIFLIVLALRRI